MTSIAESNAAGAAATALAALLLLALTRTRWLRVHDVRDSLAGGWLALRVTSVGLLTSAVVIGAMLAAALLPETGAPPDTGSWLLRSETLAAVGLVVVLCLVDAELQRRWLLLGSGIAAAAAWGGATWLVDSGLAVPIDASGAAFSAGVLCAVLVSPGRTARLVARLRRAASGVDGIHVLLVDPKGHVVHAAAPARAAVGLAARPTGRRGSPEKLPKALEEVVVGRRPEPARLRTPAGLILEARMLDLGQRRLARRARALLLRDVTSDHQHKRRLVALAHHDSLTGLANRRLFLDRLKRIVETDGTGSAALYYIDLDDFKAVNDSLGHAAGDAMLSELAERFRTQLGAEHVSRFGVPAEANVIVARLAGDEFAVIAPGVASGEAAGDLARHMTDLIRRPLELPDRTVTPSASIGIALFPAHGRDVETLLQRADSALYLAKSRGRQRYALYEASLDEKADRARLVEEGLRTALERGEMCLHYQPKVDTHSNELVGLEALLRWKSPTLGDVGPSEFVPVAEDRGLITTLGSWCIDEACRQLGAWREAGLELVPVAVNVSSAQFGESDLQRVVSDALKRHKADPRHLELELTESLLLDERSGVEEVLRDLRSMGVRIALDDFGTGYSALTYLNRFSLDVLKMDRGLLRDIEGDPSALGIAAAVVSMAHSLGLSVVAEGVDADDQVPLLRNMDCDHIQGFLFSPALPADEVTRFMSRRGQHAVRLAVGGGTAPGKRVAPPEPVVAPDDEPVLRDPREPAEAPAVAAPSHSSTPRRKGRVLLVDDAGQSLATVAMRLVSLGIDCHYASAVDEAHLFIAQEREAIRLIAFAPSIDLAKAKQVRDGLARTIGDTRSWVVIGERPEEDRRRAMREAGVDWVLWAPFNDAELRYVVKSAMALRDELTDRREVRVPVDLVANLQSGDRREVAVVSSLSPRGAFVEMSDPLAHGSTLRIQIDLGQEVVRAFARVVHVQPHDPARPSDPSGVGVAFYGFDKNEERLLRKAVSELQMRYLP